MCVEGQRITCRNLFFDPMGVNLYMKFPLDPYSQLTFSVLFSSTLTMGKLKDRKEGHYEKHLNITKEHQRRPATYSVQL